MSAFDWKNPDYSAVLAERRRKLARLRRDPSMLPVLKDLYKRSPEQWIADWACTYDPRNAERNLPTITPLIPMPFQIMFVQFVHQCWRTQQYGLCEKSRETGMSWLCVAFAVWLCTHYRGVSVGFGSHKAELVDELGNPKSLFEKMRILLRHLPVEFRGGWTEEHSKRNQIDFPAMGSRCTGEAGDNIGRGDRTSLFFCDEAAHQEHPLLIDAALAATTNCRIDVSSVKGMGNPFAQKVHEGVLPVFRASWRDDLRKDAEWMEKMREKVGDMIFGQEFSADYMAGVDGQLIEGHKLAACVDAHKKLGIVPTGRPRAGLDIAGTGRDLTALAIRHGVVLKHVSMWRSDSVKQSTARALGIMREFDCVYLDYDGNGIGYSVDEFVVELTDAGKRPIATSFMASEKPANSNRNFPGGTVKNEDLLKNKKAQAGWNLRYLVENTWRAINGDKSVDLDEILSIDSETVDDLTGVIAELTQPTFFSNNSDKIEVDKSPVPGCKSPNRYDAIAIAYSPREAGLPPMGPLLEMILNAPPAPGSNAAMLGHLRFF
jgi:hypothetical protein